MKRFLLAVLETGKCLFPILLWSFFLAYLSRCIPMFDPGWFVVGGTSEFYEACVNAAWFFCSTFFLVAFYVCRCIEKVCDKLISLYFTE